MGKLLSFVRYYFNNFKAYLNRMLCSSGIGSGIVNGQTELKIQHIRNGKIIKTRKVYDKVVTTAFVNDLVDTLKGDSTPYDNFKNYKYHASGTGTANEAISDVALGAQVGSRVVGTQIEGSGTNIYQSVGVITYTGTYAITEHGLFNASSNGTLMDRTKFPAINVLADDSILFTFTITFNAGG